METLGALIDKMSIINLKLWHCQEALFSTENADMSAEMKSSMQAKNDSLLGQRASMISELNAWIAQAVHDPSSLQILNPQNKMYGRFRKDG